MGARSGTGYIQQLSVQELLASTSDSADMRIVFTGSLQGDCCLLYLASSELVNNFHGTQQPMKKVLREGWQESIF